MTTKVTNLNIDTSTINEVGTLSSLTVSGNVTLGDVSNVKITGGTSGQYLSTDGTGNLSFSVVTIPAQPPHPFLFLGI